MKNFLRFSAAALCLIGGLAGSWFLYAYASKPIGETTFGACIFLSIALAVFVSLLPEIHTLKVGVGSLELTLKEIKQSEKSIKELALAIVELAESDEDGYKSHEWDERRYEAAKQKLRALTD